MSHFAVLVIGTGIVKQLEPFDENLELDRYVKYTKEELITKGREDIEDYKNSTYAEYLKDPITYEGDGKSIEHINYLKNEFPKKLEWSDEEVYNEEIRWYEAEDIGVDGEVYSTSNPKAKWDWYTIGGRYRDRLKMLSTELVTKGDTMDEYVGSLYRESIDGFGDIARKGDVDWEAIHGNKKDYDKAIRFWEMKVEGAEPITDEEKDELKWDWYKDGYYEERYKTKETYAKCCANFTMWAVVKDGVWYEKGDMGWWGMSGESDDEAVDWDLNFYNRFIEPLDDNELITVVDCHI